MGDSWGVVRTNWGVVSGSEGERFEAFQRVHEA